MNKRPGHVVVTTEVAVCSFCGRPRTLRREAHQLGALVRTIVTCETCHRTLSSTIAVGTAEPELEQAAPSAEPPAATSPEPDTEPELEVVQAKPAAARKPAARTATTKATSTSKPSAQPAPSKRKTSKKN